MILCFQKKSLEYLQLIQWYAWQINVVQKALDPEAGTQSQNFYLSVSAHILMFLRPRW